MKMLLAIALAALLSGCALPNTNVRAGAIRPTLAVRGAPQNSVLYIDGLVAGQAVEFDGVNKVLKLEEGPHQVEVRLDERAIYRERIYMSTGEARVVSVGRGQP